MPRRFTGLGHPVDHQTRDACYQQEAAVLKHPGIPLGDLEDGPREEDGFHNLVSVFQAISIFDEVTISLAQPKSGVSVSVTGEQTHGVPADANNLAAQAAALMAEEYDIEIDAHIEIKKSIPVAGGMAGGSADAAATIVAIDYLYSSIKKSL